METNILSESCVSVSESSKRKLHWEPSPTANQSAALSGANAEAAATTTRQQRRVRTHSGSNSNDTYCIRGVVSRLSMISLLLIPIISYTSRSAICSERINPTTTDLALIMTTPVSPVKIKAAHTIAPKAINTRMWCLHRPKILHGARTTSKERSMQM